MATSGGIFLSKREIITSAVIEDYRACRLSRAEAAEKLGVSEKTVQRKAKKVRLAGVAGLAHGNRGRTPPNKHSEGEKAEAIAVFKSTYFDFNMAHAHEKMIKAGQLEVSYSTFRRWCRSEGLGTSRKRRSSKTRRARERAANEGLMLQMDGSPHLWNGKDTWSLIALIDDATSDVPHAQFAHSETTWACMNVLRKAIEKKGVPEMILTDQAGWSTGSGKRHSFSQFVRACSELDIKVIGTPTAETKGRVERFNRTTQDRLIPEMRLNDVKSLADANRYLEQCYLPEWKEERTVEPISPTTRYRSVPEGIDLRDIFCLKHTRAVNRDQTVQFKNSRYRIEEPARGNLWKHEVDVHEYEDGNIAIFYGGEKLVIEKMRKPTRRWNKAS